MNWPAVKPDEMIRIMGRGINLGNTLEAPSEGAWAPRAERRHFEAYKNHGYSTVRIPVRWGPRIDSSGHIEPSFLARVKEVVGWALELDMVAVINAHHEEWILTNYWGEIHRLERVWAEIAGAFNGESNNLVFEIFNEPREGGNPFGGAQYTMGTHECNDMNRRILPIIRKTNPDRIVIIGGTGWGNHVDLMKIDLPQNDRYLMAQFHYYAPIGFTHIEQGTQYYWGGAKADWDALWRDIEKVTSWASAKGIRLFCGEFGVEHNNPKAGRDWNSALNWYTFAVKAFLHHGIGFAAWDDNGYFRIFDRDAGTKRFLAISS